MSAIHFVRHGQASWGKADYDLLSDRGVQQSSYLGMAWEAAGWRPTHAYAGSMRRHAQTAIAALDAAGPSDGYDIDVGWDEFDHVAVVDAHRPGFTTKDPKEFQAVFVEALRRWASTDHDGDYAETFAAFEQRVLGAFERTVTSLGSGQSAAVFTSGGPIAAVASYLLAGDLSLWSRLNTVIINASVTTVVSGGSGHTLLSFNEHTHLPSDMVTYR